VKAKSCELLTSETFIFEIYVGSSYPPIVIVRFEASQRYVFCFPVKSGNTKW